MAADCAALCEMCKNKRQLISPTFCQPVIEMPPSTLSRSSEPYDKETSLLTSFH